MGRRNLFLYPVAIALLEGTATVDDNLEFSVADNYMALAMQAVLLLIALLYLWLRRFDFKTWTIHFDAAAARHRHFHCELFSMTYMCCL